MKLRFGAALCTMTAMAAVLALPTAAHAEDPFQPGSLYTSAKDEKIRLWSDNTPPESGPKNLKVHLRKKGQSTRVATLTEFKDVPDQCGFECDSLYDVEADVPKLPALGEYTVDLQYTGTKGETILHKDRATLNYRIRPYFENVKASDHISQADRETVLSGDIKVYDPSTDTRKPYAGAAFTAETGGVTTALVTDAQGHFASDVTVTGFEHGSWFDETWHQTPIDLATQVDGVKVKDSLWVEVDTINARITMDSPTVSGPYATYGKISGAVTWEAPDGTWKPVPAGADTGGSGSAERTDAAGRFSHTVLFDGDRSLSVTAAGPWLKSPSQQVWLDTTAGTSFSEFSVDMDQYKRVTARASFKRAAIPDSVKTLKVEVQQSPDGKTGWTTRATVDVPAPSADLIEARVPGTGPGFVRLRYAGTTAIRGSESKAVEIPQRTLTSIPEFNAAPEPVKKGKPITVTGKLKHADPTWKPLAGQTVHYYFRPAGTTTWKMMGNSKTAADGTFTKSFTASRTGSWKARYFRADATHLYSVSRVDEVAVTP
ncbi:hypothetical protein ACFYYB_38165 [Streptomyces sp. NPDC002886]|uniref:hypothetical protein n=1 Tax=Streptomyces sp. NPDC002886 TaxID=3364667 RepID=UPI0036B950C9